MPQKEFSSQFLSDQVHGYESDGHHVATEEIGDSRWGDYMLTVFRDPEDDRRVYGFEWFEGATENQDNEYPWGYYYDISEDNMIACDEYIISEEIVTKYHYDKAPS